MSEKKKPAVMSDIAWDSVKPVAAPLLRVFNLNKEDLIVMGLMVLSTVLVWLSACRHVAFRQVFTYWDGVNFLVQKHKNLDQWIVKWKDAYRRDTNRTTSQNLMPLKVHHYILSSFVMASFGNVLIGQVLYTLVFSILSVYLFRRLLLAYGFKKYTLHMCIFFMVYPIRWTLFRSTSTYDSLMMCEIMLALILYKIDQPILCLIVCLLGSLTRFEMALMFIVFAICYFIGRDVHHGVSFGGIGIAVMLFVTRMWPDWSDHIVPNAINRGKERDIERFNSDLFGLFWTVKNSIGNLRLIHTIHMSWFPCFFGAALLLPQSLPLSVFGFIYALYVSLIQSKDMNRFSIPCHSLVFLVSLRFFLTDRIPRFVLTWGAPIAFLVEVYICGYQFKSRQWGMDLIDDLLHNI